MSVGRKMVASPVEIAGNMLRRKGYLILETARLTYRDVRDAEWCERRPEDWEVNYTVAGEWQISW